MLLKKNNISILIHVTSMLTFILRRVNLSLQLILDSYIQFPPEAENVNPNLDGPDFLFN